MSILERVEVVFRDVFNDDSIVLDNSFNAHNRQDWDSVANLNLMFSLEQSFGVTFHGAEFTNLKNVGELCACISKKFERRDG